MSEYAVIDGKTQTERMKQIRGVGFYRVRPLTELREITRTKVCRACGGKLTLRIMNNFDCDGKTLFSRTQYPVCVSDYCQRTEWGVDPVVYKRALSYVKERNWSKYDYKNFDYRGKVKRYRYYDMYQNVRYLLDEWFELKRWFEPEPQP